MSERAIDEGRGDGLDLRDVCPVCHGFGDSEDDYTPCRACNGTGQRAPSQPRKDGGE